MLLVTYRDDLNFGVFFLALIVRHRHTCWGMSNFENVLFCAFFYRAYSPAKVADQIPIKGMLVHVIALPTEVWAGSDSGFDALDRSVLPTLLVLHESFSDLIIALLSYQCVQLQTRDQLRDPVFSLRQSMKSRVNLEIVEKVNSIVSRKAQ